MGKRIALSAELVTINISEKERERKKRNRKREDKWSRLLFVRSCASFDSCWLYPSFLLSWNQQQPSCNKHLRSFLILFVSDTHTQVLLVSVSEFSNKSDAVCNGVSSGGWHMINCPLKRNEKLTSFTHYHE